MIVMTNNERTPAVDEVEYDVVWRVRGDGDVEYGMVMEANT